MDSKREMVCHDESNPNSDSFSAALKSSAASEVTFQKRVRGFHQVSKREKHLKPRGRRPSDFIVFERLET